MPPLNETQATTTTNSANLKMTSPAGLFGREQEAATLRTCFQRMMDTKRASLEFNNNNRYSFTNSNIPKEIIFIKGHSGVGKSSLAACLKQNVSASQHGLFVEGKFDLMTSNEPYTGIAKAFGKICRQLQSSPAHNSVCKMISCDYREEMQPLLPLIPDLKEIVNSHASLTKTTVLMDAGNNNNRTVKNGTEQFKYAFRMLVRALNAAFTPIVLVLDDLQWADLSSLHVIDYLVSDRQNANRLMIIGCYRSEEVLEKSNLSSLIDSLEEKKDNYGFHVTEIALNSCQVDHVNKMIMAILAIDDEQETKELAEICYRRTLGNPFFVIQFMAMLENEALVSYKNHPESKWAWNVDEIERRTKNTMDVVSLLQARMRKLPEDAQLLLQYAACLGTSFSLSTIDIIWKEHGAEGGSDVSDLEKLLILIQGSGFLESDGDHTYKWVHDKVQEAAMSLSNLVNASFKFKIGKTLVSALDEEQLEDELFDVVDLINRGNVATRPELAALNLRAAKKAKGLGAYQSAAKYVEFGAALLPRSHWTSHRELTLELYTVGAEMELALGNSRQAASYCNAVLNRKDCTLMEGLPFRMAVIAKLTGGDSSLKRKALDMCLELLASLGYKFLGPKPLLPLQTLRTVIQTGKKTKQRLGQKGLSDSLGEMTDPKHLAIMELLERVGFLAYSLEQILITALSTCHMMKMTLKHGKSKLAGKAFTDMGIIMWIVLKEEFSTVVSCAQQGLSLQKELDPQHEGNALWTGYVFTLCWSVPLEKCIQPMLQAYESSMKVGDVEYGMWSMCSLHTWIPYAQGSPIKKMLQKSPHLASHMEELQQIEASMYTKMYWQLFLNLQSATENGSKLTGIVYDCERFPVTSGTNIGTHHFVEGELIFMYDFEMAADRAVQCGDKYQKLVPCGMVGMMEMFHRGVALYVMARRSGKRKYRNRAMKIRKTIKQWVRDGNPNVAHYDIFLDAEHLSLTSKGHAEADSFYKKAIEAATRVGHLQHKGVFNERYADFLLQIRGDEAGASRHLSEAIAGYQQWGALRKVDQLQQQLRKQKPQ